MKTRVVLAGGGLANCLLAWRLIEKRPDLELIVLEASETLGGSHVWCYHDGDLTTSQHDWLQPLVERSWTSYEVRFPQLRRRFQSGYHAVTSSRLHGVLSGVLGNRVRYGCKVAEVAPREARLSDGEVIRGDIVVDGRGDPGSSSLTIAFQKFVGLELTLDRRHELAGPILMDATVEQLDGYRFLYTLPFDEQRVLVEDTRYSDTPALDPRELREQVLSYVRAQGWSVREQGREERGVLPIVLAGNIDSFWDRHSPGVPRSGLRAALFHPTTGYSLPESVRLADEVVHGTWSDRRDLYSWIRARSAARWHRDRFFRLLNRMLFRAARPEMRWRVLQTFYGLPESLIHRFYAGTPTLADRIRILVGRPPVPLLHALKCLPEPRVRGAS